MNNRCKMIGMIRNVSVYKLHSLDMCGVILVVTPRGDMKGPPKAQQTIKQHIKAFSRHSKHDESNDVRHQTTIKQKLKAFGPMYPPPQNDICSDLSWKSFNTLEVLLLLICKIPHYECDLSKRSKMIRIIRTMSVYESYRVEVCEAILATAQRGDIRGTPSTNNTQSNKPSRLSRSIQNIMNPMTYNTKRRSNKSSRLSDLCPTS